MSTEDKIVCEINIVMFWTVISSIFCLFIANGVWWLGVVGLCVVVLIMLTYLKLSVDVFMTNNVGKGDRDEKH